MTMTTHTQQANIRKNPRGWSIETIQHWADFGDAKTYQGCTRLGWAIFLVANWCARNDTALISLTVNGEPYPQDKAEAAIRRFGIDYEIPGALASLRLEA